MCHDRLAVFPQLSLTLEKMLLSLPVERGRPSKSSKKRGRPGRPRILLSPTLGAKRPAESIGNDSWVDMRDQAGPYGFCHSTHQLIISNQNLPYKNLFFHKKLSISKNEPELKRPNLKGFLPIPNSEKVTVG